MRSIPAAFTPAALPHGHNLPPVVRVDADFFVGFSEFPGDGRIKSPIIANYNETNYPLQLAIKMNV